MNDSMKELEKKIKNSWQTLDLTEGAQQAILYNIKMHQSSKISHSIVKRYRVAYVLSLITALLIAFIVVTPMFYKHQSVGPKPTVQKDPTVNEAHPPNVQEEPKPEFFFPQKFPDKDSVFIDENRGWKIIHGEKGGMFKEAVSISETQDGGKTWKNNFNIDGLDNSDFFTGYKMGITFINNKRGWISIFVDPDPKSPYLLLTNDGGKTWEKQYLPILDEFNQELRQITRPIFFSGSDGLIPIITYEGDSRKLLYMEVTDDAGRTWTPITEQSSGNLTWDFSDPKKGTVTFKNHTWVTPDLGETWHSQ
ncbi:MAG: WD40/YVTN/BNR-like repeat-containing protein [Heyndrickxia sp.]